MGANIQYPYHELPIMSTDDRVGFWALLGVYEDLAEEMNETEDEDRTKKKKDIDCGVKRDDEK
ncbi:MAG: hypothetical protein ACTSVR_04880 [Candidatus Thorarchaeota archaeon]